MEKIEPQLINNNNNLQHSTGYHKWTDTRLTAEELDFLVRATEAARRNPINDSVSVNHQSFQASLAGNISKSEKLEDKNNWFYETVLKKQIEKLFLSTDNNYYKYHIEKEEPLPEFEMSSFWVNYQKKHEFNPLHNHNGFYSFVVFMNIPTHWEEQHALPFSVHSNAPCASNFVFVYSENEQIKKTEFRLSPEDEGRMLFFPATLQHMVHPFYECEEERVTISGNILQKDSKEEKHPVMPETIVLTGDVYEEKENMLKIMENGVELMKKDLEQMKKTESIAPASQNSEKK